MAIICDIKASAERIRQKLMEIENLTVTAQISGSHTGLQGRKYRIYGEALAKIAILVRDSSQCSEYWYAKFVESGRLVQPKTEDK